MHHNDFSTFSHIPLFFRKLEQSRPCAATPCPTIRSSLYFQGGTELLNFNTGSHFYFLEYIYCRAYKVSRPTFDVRLEYRHILITVKLLSSFWLGLNQWYNKWTNYSNQTDQSRGTTHWNVSVKFILYVSGISYYMLWLFVKFTFFVIIFLKKTTKIYVLNNDNKCSGLISYSSECERAYKFSNTCTMQRSVGVRPPDKKAMAYTKIAQIKPHKRYPRTI